MFLVLYAQTGEVVLHAVAKHAHVMTIRPGLVQQPHQRPIHLGPEPDGDYLLKCNIVCTYSKGKLY